MRVGVKDIEFPSGNVLVDVGYFPCLFGWIPDGLAVRPSLLDALDPRRVSLRCCMATTSIAQVSLQPLHTHARPCSRWMNWFGTDDWPQGGRGDGGVVSCRSTGRTRQSVFELQPQNRARTSPSAPPTLSPPSILTTPRTAVR